MKNTLILTICALLCWGCESSTPSLPICEDVTDIVGNYTCTGECIITDAGGNRSVITVSEETDDIQPYPGAKESLYQVNISGANNFSELELGVLKGNVLRTATAAVSDSIYPVLEEYVFDSNDDCQATGFTKIVRNPSEANFKTCVIICRKS